MTAPRGRSGRREAGRPRATRGGRRGALLLAAVSIAVVLVSPARAQSATLTPAQGPPGQRVTVSGSGYTPDQPCRIRWTGPEGGSRVLAGVDACAADDTGGITHTVRVPTDTAPGAATVEICQLCDSEFEARSAADFRVVAPTPEATLTPDPAAAPVDAEVAVSGQGFTIDLPLTLQLDGRTVAELDAVGPEWTGNEAFTVTITVPARPGGAVTLRACQRCGSEFEVAATTRLVVQASLTVRPDVVQPGEVATVTGTGLPADRAVTLRWQPGLGQAQAPTDAQGQLSAPLLVFHRDVTGPRWVVATLPEVSELPLEERPRLSTGPLTLAEVELLVVPGTLQPSGFTHRR